MAEVKSEIYNLSKDYEKLWSLIQSGHTVAGYANVEGKNYDVIIGRPADTHPERICGYFIKGGSIYFFDNMGSKGDFIDKCKKINLQAEEKKIMWRFMYNFGKDEGGFQMISLHETKEGAEKAMQDHKTGAIAFAKKMNFDGFVFPEDKDWEVRRTEVLP